MKRETIVWTALCVLGGAWLWWRAAHEPGMARVFVKAVHHEFVRVPATQPGELEWVAANSPQAILFDPAIAGTDDRMSWTIEEPASAKDYATALADDPNQTTFRESRARTSGVWVAVFFTLAIFSFLYRDNPFYKLAEAVVVGVSAGYWMVAAFWDVLVPNLLGKLWPAAVQAWAIPGLQAQREWTYLVPLILGIMLLWRLSPRGAWIARWPLAFIIGTTAGIRMTGYIDADFLAQVRASVVPLVVVEDDAIDVGSSIKNIVLVIGILSCLVYFFFSVEHKGMIGRVARVGIWFLMVTFGAGFGYTVMGRIALLAIRLEFLFDDWLWWIDPKDVRPDGW